MKKEINLDYILSNIADLAGLPVRIYQNGKLNYFHSIIDFKVDPINAYLDKIAIGNQHVGYYITEELSYYGFVNSNNLTIIIGPTYQCQADDKSLKDLAFRLNISSEDVTSFINAYKSLVPFPLTGLLKILLVLNNLINEEMLTFNDIIVIDEEQERFEKAIEKIQIDNQYSSQQEINNFNNSLLAEEKLISIVRNGDIDGLNTWIQSSPSVNPGLTSSNQIRQLKNIFIVTATIVCRAAISSGMNQQEALKLSDTYIQRCDILNDIVSINNLSFKLVKHYTEIIHSLSEDILPNKLSRDILSYVLHHLSENIKTEDIANALYMSRGRLSTKFKSECHENLSTFIIKIKLKEAKRLIRYTDKSLTSISEYLGFSTPNHFSAVFKKYEKLSPLEYRKQFINFPKH